MKANGFVGWYQLMRLTIIKAALDQGVDHNMSTRIAAQAVNDMRASTNLDLVVKTLAEIDARVAKENNDT